MYGRMVRAAAWACGQEVGGDCGGALLDERFARMTEGVAMQAPAEL